MTLLEFYGNSTELYKENLDAMAWSVICCCGFHSFTPRWVLLAVDVKALPATLNQRKTAPKFVPSHCNYNHATSKSQQEQQQHENTVNIRELSITSSISPCSLSVRTLTYLCQVSVQARKRYCLLGLLCAYCNVVTLFAQGVRACCFCATTTATTTTATTAIRAATHRLFQLCFHYCRCWKSTRAGLQPMCCKSRPNWGQTRETERCRCLSKGLLTANWRSLQSLVSLGKAWFCFSAPHRWTIKDRGLKL